MKARVRKKLSVGASLFAIGGLCWVPPVQAQEVGVAIATDTAAADRNEAEDEEAPGSPALEEIVVTAQRRAENLTDVPLSISAVSGDTLEQERIETVADLEGEVPNFKFSRFNLSDTQLFIRGIGSGLDSPAADRSIAIFIDDVYIGRAAGAASDIFDLERVEILRGPQGTLYGKNVVGGAINYVTANPTRTLTGRVRAGVGNFGLYEAAGVVSGPLSDEWAASLAGSYRNFGGFTTNLSTGNRLDDVEAVTARTVLANNGGPLRVRIAADYAKSSGRGPGMYAWRNGTSAIGIRDSWRVGSTPRRFHSGPDGHQEVETYGISARLDFDVLGGDLTSISAYRRAKSDIFTSYAGTGIARTLAGFPQAPQTFDFFNEIQEDAAQLSQELRYLWENNAWTILAGAFVIREKVERMERTTQPLPSGAAPYNQDDLDGATTSYAGFLDLTFRPVEALELNAGIRYTRDNRNFDLLHTGTGSRFGIFPTNPFIADLEESWGAITPKASVRFAVTEDINLYALVSRGYKSGGFNGQPTDLVGVTPFNPEYVWNYEIGTKGHLFDRRVRFELAAFQMDYSDLQVQAVFTLPNSPITGVSITNAAAATIRGIEASAQVAVTDELEIGGTFGHLSTRITDSTVATIAIGNELPSAPKFSYSLNAVYNTQIGDSHEFTGRVEYAYSGRSQQNVENLPVGIKQAYGLFDASLRFAQIDQGFELSLWGKNLTNNLYESFIIPSAVGGITRFGPPRTYGVSVGYRW